MTDRVLAQIAALAKASLPDLKAQWRELFGKEPSGINRVYLERRIAYRLQELAYGGLSDATRARLTDLAKTADRGSSPRTRMRAQDRPIAGTRLLRVWQGVEHSVTVMQTGFDYQGRSFASLSAVARQITGSRWNGPAFFGLREQRL
jgi:Protein of unknown function (DUF2924)